MREVVALGFVEITQEGRAGNAEWRRPNFFRLTYRHTEKTEPTDDWRKIKRWRRRSLSRALLDRLLKNKSPVAENAKSQCGLCTTDGKSLVRIPPLQALVRIPPLHLYLGAKSVGEVVQFPSRSQRPTGVRMAPSHRIAEMYELQVFEDGRWRAKSIHYSIEEQKRLPQISSWPVWIGVHNERRTMTAASTIIAGGIDLLQAVRGLDQTPSRAYPSAQRGILGQHFLSALNRELSPVDALPGIGHRASLGFHGVHHNLPTHGGPDRSLPAEPSRGTSYLPTFFCPAC
nr:hypothetical protein [Mesorhizobium ciceri]